MLHSPTVLPLWRLKDDYAAQVYYCAAPRPIGRRLQAKSSGFSATPCQQGPHERRSWRGKLGSKVGVAPRIFLRKLVATILDRVDLFPDFDPAKDLDIRIDAEELTLKEQAAAADKKPDDIEIDL